MSYSSHHFYPQHTGYGQQSPYPPIHESDQVNHHNDTNFNHNYAQPSAIAHVPEFPDASTAQAVTQLAQGHVAVGDTNTAQPDGENSNTAWLYPHKRGSNLVDWKDEIVQRTRNGESCLQIAEALAVKGVQTSSKAVARQRIIWGFRKRAPKKPNPNKPSRPPRAGLARRSDKKYVTAKMKAAERHKADITAMTQQGLTPEEIAQIMESRGMPLNKGVSTIRRLQSTWKLLVDPKRHLANIRHLARRKARSQQKEQFMVYAGELGLQNKEAWVAQKMTEPAALEMRKQRAAQLMGDDAPPSYTRSAKLKDGQGTQTTKKKRPGRPRKTHNEDGHGDGDADAVTDSSLSQNQRVTRDAKSTLHRPAGESHNITKRQGQPSSDESEEDSSESESENEATGDPDFNASNPAISTGPRLAPPSQTAATSEQHVNKNGEEGEYDDSEAGYAPLMDADHDDDDSEDADGEPVTAPQPTNSGPPVAQSDRLPDLAALLAPSAEEISTNRSTIVSTSTCMALAQELKNILEARNTGRPAQDSLTGLPPSSADVQNARQKLKYAARTMLEML